MCTCIKGKKLLQVNNFLLIKVFQATRSLNEIVAKYFDLYTHVYYIFTV